MSCCICNCIISCIQTKLLTYLISNYQHNIHLIGINSSFHSSIHQFYASIPYIHISIPIHPFYSIHSYIHFVHPHIHSIHASTFLSLTKMSGIVSLFIPSDPTAYTEIKSCLSNKKQHITQSDPLPQPEAQSPSFHLSSLQSQDNSLIDSSFPSSDDVNPTSFVTTTASLDNLYPSV